MTGYTKLFGTIIGSTIWREDDKTRIVWITMLAMANKFGIVEASLPGLADFARVSLDECRASLSKLAAPDEHSRTKDYEGRRIKEIDGGWEILNHLKYREKMGADERREYLRQKQQEQRDKKKKSSTKRQQTSTGVNNGSDSSTESTHADADADAEALKNNAADGGLSLSPPSPDELSARAKARGTKEELEAYAVEIGLPASDGAFMHDHWTANGWKNGQAPSRDWRAGIRKWKSQKWLPSQKQTHHPKTNANSIPTGGALNQGRY